MVVSTTSREVHVRTAILRPREPRITHALSALGMDGVDVSHRTLSDIVNFNGNTGKPTPKNSKIMQKNLGLKIETA